MKNPPECRRSVSVDGNVLERPEEKERTYQYFVRCCHDYLNNVDRLLNDFGSTEKNTKDDLFAKENELDYVLQKTLKEQIGFVESSFEKLNKKDPILSEIMYLNLVEKKTFDEIGQKRLVAVSRRSASRKYPKKDWERAFNETVLG